MEALIIAALLFYFARSALSYMDYRTAIQNLVPVKATLDGQTYLVLDAPHKAAAANMLARTRSNMWKIMQYVRTIQSEQKDPLIRTGIGTLVFKHKAPSNIRLYELDSTLTNSLAFNQNKSQYIFICLRRDLASMELAADDTVTFIALHELAHTMNIHTDPVDAQGRTVHSSEFRKLEKFLFATATKLGLLYPESVPGRSHCNSVIARPDEAV